VNSAFHLLTRCVVFLAAAAVWAETLEPAPTHGQTYVRWAILGSPAAARAGILDLTQLEVQRIPNIELVERNQLDLLNRELEIGALLGAGNAALRVRAGARLSADALLCLDVVTVEDATCLKAVVSDCKLGARLHYSLEPCGERLPVEFVSYAEDVRGGTWPGGRPADGTFLGLLRKRTGLSFDLPTNAQWEYACRAGTTNDFNNDTVCTVADGVETNLRNLGWYAANSQGDAHAVGLLIPNRWGLFDMHGNVQELCRDWFERYDRIETVSDPSGPPFGALERDRVCRGGGYDSIASCLRSGDRRGYCGPSERREAIGFRVAGTLNAVPQGP